MVMSRAPMQPGSGYPGTWELSNATRWVSREACYVGGEQHFTPRYSLPKERPYECLASNSSLGCTVFSERLSSEEERRDRCCGLSSSVARGTWAPTLCPAWCKVATRFSLSAGVRASRIVTTLHGNRWSM